MFPLYEFKIVKALGVAGFVAAVMIATMITFNSGILGKGSGPGSAALIETPASAAGAAAAQAESGGQPAATPTTGTRTHIVADGDSFASIARKYDVSISDIVKLNPNIDPQNLKVGITLVIP